jgi:predicted enzyme related to lactoylglutathione lyase
MSRSTDAPGGTPARHVLTILAVADLPRAREFYDRAFGWKREWDLPVYCEYSMPGGMLLGLYDRRGFARITGLAPAAVPEGAISATEIYLRVEDLDGAAARLAAAGARLLSPAAPREWGDDAAYFADPDGNVLVVARPTPGR